MTAIRFFATLLLAAFVIGCGDDGTPTDSAMPMDSSADTSPGDTGTDAVADSSLDGAADSSADSTVADSAVDSAIDAPPTTGAVVGDVTTTAPCADTAPADCVGTLHVVLFDADTGWDATVVARTMVADADLSDGAAVGYRIEGLDPGDYHVRAFLDDDGNADPTTPVPGVNDPAHAGSFPVTVTVGEDTTQDIVLDQRVVG